MQTLEVESQFLLLPDHIPPPDTLNESPPPPMPLHPESPFLLGAPREEEKIYNFPGPRMEEDQWESPGAVVSLEILGGAIGERREGAECVTPQATKDLLRVSRGSI